MKGKGEQTDSGRSERREEEERENCARPNERKTTHGISARVREKATGRVKEHSEETDALADQQESFDHRRWRRTHLSPCGKRTWR